MGSLADLLNNAAAIEKDETIARLQSQLQVPPHLIVEQTTEQLQRHFDDERVALATAHLDRVAELIDEWTTDDLPE